MFYAPQSGGVRRYLTTKHEWLTTKTHVRHTIVAPGAAERVATDGVHRLASLVPLADGYRLPLHGDYWRRRLVGLRPDLIEAGDPYIPAWASLAAAHELGVPAVAFCHAWPTQLADEWLGGWCRPAVAAYVGALYRRFDMVLAASQYVAGRLRAFGVERVMMQPLGVDTEAFHPNRRDPLLRRRLGLSDAAKLLVFAGRFVHQKNIPVLIEAARLLGPDYHLLLIGASNDGPSRRGNATVLPFQSGGLPGLLASCDVLVHAGELETFGLIVLEAFACGIPAVVVSAGAVAELVSPESGAVVAPRNPGEMAAAIRDVVARDPAALGAAARDWVAHHHSIDAVLHSLFGHYARLVGSAPATLVPARQT